jgi:hypothetical protein
LVSDAAQDVPLLNKNLIFELFGSGGTDLNGRHADYGNRGEAPLGDIIEPCFAFRAAVLPEGGG